MNIGKNLRTKISTIIAIGAYLNLCLSHFDPSIIAGNEKAVKVYQILSFIFAFCAWANSHYFNQDFTVEGDAGTKLTRDMKAMRNIASEPSEEPEDSYSDVYEVFDYGDGEVFMTAESEVSEDDR